MSKIQAFGHHSFYPPWLQEGAGDFPLGGGAGKFLVCRGGYPFRGGLQNLGGAEDFDKFCKNVIEKFSKIK